MHPNSMIHGNSSQIPNVIVKSNFRQEGYRLISLTDGASLFTEHVRILVYLLEILWSVIVKRRVNKASMCIISWLTENKHIRSKKHKKIFDINDVSIILQTINIQFFEPLSSNLSN